VLPYHAANEAFPCDPTLDQLYTASRADAYVELGTLRPGATRTIRNHGYLGRDQLTA
jgi:hypothetical protein